MISREGYINDRIMFELGEFISQLKFSSFEINGTMDKVEKGEDVFLVIEVDSKNSCGGIIRSSRIPETGIAR